jgi:hypothetical protein
MTHLSFLTQPKWQKIDATLGTNWHSGEPLVSRLRGRFVTALVRHLQTAMLVGQNWHVYPSRAGRIQSVG